LTFQEQRTSQLPLELDQITDDSAPARPDADIKSEYHVTFNTRNVKRIVIIFFISSRRERESGGITCKEGRKPQTRNQSRWRERG